MALQLSCNRINISRVKTYKYILDLDKYKLPFGQMDMGELECVGGGSPKSILGQTPIIK